jgi:6-phosphofructokinase 1
LTIGGSILGSSRNVPKSQKQMQQIGSSIKQFKLDAIVVIGGFEGYIGVNSVVNSFKSDSILSNVRWICIPATISNNVPGTEVNLNNTNRIKRP